MKQEVNIFGDRICVKEDCPAFFSNEKYGEFCNAKLDFVGLLLPIDGEPQHGMLCKLPIEFEIVRREGERYE